MTIDYFLEKLRDPEQQQNYDSYKKKINELKKMRFYQGFELNNFIDGNAFLKFRIVDNVNGYMKIWNGSAYGTDMTGKLMLQYQTTEEVALFRDIKNISHLVLSYYSETSKPEYVSITIWSSIEVKKIFNGKIIPLEATGFIPAIKFDDFLKSTISADAKKSIKYFTVVYYLPRHGTNITVKIKFDNSENNKTADSRKAEKEIKSKMKYKAIILGWDNRIGKFYVKTKVPV